jgi:hypothetical protein
VDAKRHHYQKKTLGFWLACAALVNQCVVGRPVWTPWNQMDTSVMIAIITKTHTTMTAVLALPVRTAGMLRSIPKTNLQIR